MNNSFFHQYKCTSIGFADTRKLVKVELSPEFFCGNIKLKQQKDTFKFKLLRLRDWLHNVFINRINKKPIKQDKIVGQEVVWYCGMWFHPDALRYVLNEAYFNFTMLSTAPCTYLNCGWYDSTNKKLVVANFCKEDVSAYYEVCKDYNYLQFDKYNRVVGTTDNCLEFLVLAADQKVWNAVKHLANGYGFSTFLEILRRETRIKLHTRKGAKENHKAVSAFFDLIEHARLVKRGF